jgi:hypothetical protein
VHWKLINAVSLPNSNPRISEYVGKLFVYQSSVFGYDDNLANFRPGTQFLEKKLSHFRLGGANFNENREGKGLSSSDAAN